MKRVIWCLCILLTGCATIPPESVWLSIQVEKNLDTLKANNLILLRAWRDLSIDYWTEQVARRGPEIILAKARERGIRVDLNTDYPDLVARVMDQYKSNFLSKIDDLYISYRDKIIADFDTTGEAARQMTALLRSAVRLDAERERALQSALGTLGVDNAILNLSTELHKELPPAQP
jgi:hypothetical protein